ncbi:MAG TPA: SEC-C metal-binding domain-containing protein, partial [Terriglobales bacterium]
GQWKEHLLNMDHLKEGIGLRGYGQHDPLVEYKRESFDMFEAMMQRFQEDTIRHLYFMQVVGPNGEILTGSGPTSGRDEQAVRNGQAPALVSHQSRPNENGDGARQARNVTTSVDQMEREFQRKKQRELEQARMAGAGEAQVQQRRTGEKVGRNDPCPCGSGKKYKKCCGA